jgi:Family of unknown function (DUF6311)
MNPVRSNTAARSVIGKSALRLLDRLSAPRRLATLVLVSLAIGIAHALAILPIPLVTGTSAFWIFPHGTIPGAENDMAQVLTGQMFLQTSPWTWPLLQVPNLGFPTGTNIFWIDAVPIVALVAKLLAGIMHAPVNLLGFDLFVCLVLPGVAMTGLAWVAGQRYLLAAVTASAIADAAPTLLYRWGHIPLMAQFLVIAALGLYLLNQHRPTDRRVGAAWLSLLGVTLLTNFYLFAMVGACWSAALLQRKLNGAASMAYLVIEALVAISLMLTVMLVTGIVVPGASSSNVNVISAGGFGGFSTNLGSLFVPQMSVVLPGLVHYRIGMGMQYEGFGYVGTGTLLLLMAGLPHGVGWLRGAAHRHSVLLAIVVGSFLFALSNHIYLGSHQLVTIPLPYRVLRLFNLFRSSGRFVWLPGYAIMAGSIVLCLKQPRPQWMGVICLAAAALQIADAAPLRAAIRATVSGPTPAVFDRDQAAALAARASAIEVFPSYGCVEKVIAAGIDPDSDWVRLTQANLEFQLIAARADFPINSVYQSRLPTDCRAETAERAALLRPGTLYVYLDAPAAATGQLGGHDVAKACGTIDWIHYCLIPPVGD